MAIDRRRFRLGMLLGVGVSLVLIAGCGGSPGAAYQPKEDFARKALDDALSTWSKGGKPDQLSSGTPPVHVADSQWTSGVALEGFEVVGTEPAVGDEPAWFKVVLKLKKPLGDKEVRYTVLGKDDLWVYRDEDYARFLKMDNNPRQTPKAGRPSSPSRR
jgi:hypothetical protein